MRFRSLALAVCAAFLITACDDEVTAPSVDDSPTAPSAQRLDAIFASAGKEYNVPADLLRSIGYVETRFQMVRGEVEFDGMPPAFGIMALRGERLTRGASLARVSVGAARTDATANIRSAAALLSAYADELKVNRADLQAWAPAVARFSGIEGMEGQAMYVHNDVYAALRSGIRAKSATGAVLVSVSPQNVSADFTRPSTSASAMACAPDYCATGTIWRASPNYSTRSTGIHYVIIHTCESSYSGCWSWLTNSSSGVSAHYVVNESGSEISQLVRETGKAWHIGANYDCANNGGHDCGNNGIQANNLTIGIEHGGYASQTSFPVGQIDASAKLSCNISKDQKIPRDRYHFVGHGQLQPYNRTDPGSNWPWSDYMNRINSHCGATSIIVDSNNNNNDTSKGYIEVSANWSSSASTAGYYGTGYFYATTAAVSDPATFYFYLPAAATKTVDAWWTAGSNRSKTAPFVAWNASGTKLGTVYADQTINGGKWNALGSYSFSAGWNKVQLSRWTTAGSVVIADAVRIR